MSGGACVHCGCSDIEKDPAQGVAVCTNCGSVLEEQLIVSQVQFEENNRGGSNVIGQYVSAEGGKSMNLGMGFHHGMGKESRAITLANGKRRINHLGSQLHLNQHCVDTAYNFFKMAVARQLTRGRRTTHITAACLYLVCRSEGTPHMLLDFADILQANVYALGRTYLHLSRELCIKLPALDPCLYIQRFAHRLEFADKTHDVAKTALRLVGRMKRDWMVQGRRPSGLCGAALLVAARIHNFSRSIKEIIRVVNISEGTIRKRLSEFEATSSSALTVEEFQNIDLEEEADPPCFTESRKKAKLQQLEDAGELPKLTEEVAQLQNEIDQALQDMMQKKHRHLGKDNIPRLGGDKSCNTSTTSDIGEDINRLLDQDSIREVFLRAGVGRDDDDDDDDDGCAALRKASACGSNLEEKDPAVARLEDDELNMLLRPVTTPGPRPRVTAASLGIMDSIELCMGEKKAAEEEKEEEEEEPPRIEEIGSDGIDEDEMDSYIMSEGEVKIKALAWIKANADYLKEQKEKQAREAKDREDNKHKPEKKKRRFAKKHKEASSAAEAIERVIAEKKISSKINYDVLKGLTAPTTQTTIQTASGACLLESGPIEATPVMLKSPKGRFRRSSMTLDDGPLSKRARGLPPMKHNVKAESVKEEDSNPPAALGTGARVRGATTAADQVIVESGPVEYTSHDTYDEEEEDDDDDEEEEVLSTAQMMGHKEEDMAGYDDDDFGDYD